MRRQKIVTNDVKLVSTIGNNTLDLVVFSHLRWNYVYQRPQHLLSRGAQAQRVFYVEEPIIDGGPSRLEVFSDDSRVVVAVPHLSRILDKFEGRATHRALIDLLFEQQAIQDYILWYYTPMAVGYTDHLKPRVVIYDCMDELSAFAGAPVKMKDYESLLLQRADLVFTGGHSLYEVKRFSNPNVHFFPSSIDAEHFRQARTPLEEPPDQAVIPHPRLGFFGVIDERLDIDLLDGIAAARPDWHLVMVGPIAKIEPSILPKRPNIHYLGMKHYKVLPNYLSGWDVALLPFAQNESTRFISPTKTPEYLAGGKHVVSSPIRDVIRPYGEIGLVEISNGVDEFVQAIERSLRTKEDQTEWQSRVDEFLAQNSWDLTWMSMAQLIQAAAYKNFGSFQLNFDPNQPMPETALSIPVNIPTKSHPVSSRGNNANVFDYLIVGAGYAGSILAERLACGSGKKVLLIDCRPHIGGNAYDYYNQDGIQVHKYGPHIFHTNSREVFTYLSRFTQWRPYEHKVRASVDGHLLPLPINLDTVNQLYGMSLNSTELEKFFETQAEHREEIRTSEDVVISKVGRHLYEKFFHNYTRKQWGLDPSELDASVTARVPVRLSRDDRYFTDIFQSMPLYGYTRMFENMLDHPNIKIMLNTDYRDLLGYINYREMIFTGPIDEFFENRYGKLPYRSLHFEFETLDEKMHQPVAVVNYPNEHLFTRVTEFKHLTGQEHAKTTLVYEYPCAEGDPYYPIPRPGNADLYHKYKELADSLPGVYFAGRLATYKYYNMDQVAAQALTLYAKITGIPRNESISAYSANRFRIELPCSLMMSEETD